MTPDQAIKLFVTNGVPYDQAVSAVHKAERARMMDILKDDPDAATTAARDEKLDKIWTTAKALHKLGGFKSLSDAVDAASRHLAEQNNSLGIR